jgi:hypothetical protein
MSTVCEAVCSYTLLVRNPPVVQIHEILALGKVALRQDTELIIQWP